MSNETNKMIPELRFPEFANDGEWEEKLLGELIEIKGRIGYRGYTTNDIVSKGEGAISMSPSNIDEHGSLSLEKSTYITWDKYDESPEIMLQDGFTVLVKTGSTYGKVAYIKNLVNKATINPQLVVLKPTNINCFFLYLLVANISVQKQIQETVVGGAIPTLSQDSISKFRVFVPKLLEQQKIASCLSSLDEVIAAHSQKLEVLKVHKKGLMQTLFLQEGETVPKYRFPEFVNDGDWEEKKLGKCLMLNPEYGINAPAVPFSDNLPTYLRITDISEDGRFLANDKVSVDRNVTENNYLTEGDIVLARTGASVGKSYKYCVKDGRLVFAGFLIRVKPNSSILKSDFLFQFLSTSQYWRWVGFVSARSGQPGINGTEYSSMPIKLPPTINEQQKIADCLSSLDTLITAQADKIEQLKLHKKGLMQGLFPTILN